MFTQKQQLLIILQHLYNLWCDQFPGEASLQNFLYHRNFFCFVHIPYHDMEWYNNQIISKIMDIS